MYPPPHTCSLASALSWSSLCLFARCRMCSHTRMRSLSWFLLSLPLSPSPSVTLSLRPSKSLMVRSPHMTCILLLIHARPPSVILSLRPSKSLITLSLLSLSCILLLINYSLSTFSHSLPCSLTRLPPFPPSLSRSLALVPSHALTHTYILSLSRSLARVLSCSLARSLSLYPLSYTRACMRRRIHALSLSILSLTHINTHARERKRSLSLPPLSLSHSLTHRLPFDCVIDCFFLIDIILNFNTGNRICSL